MELRVQLSTIVDLTTITVERTLIVEGLDIRSRTQRVCAQRMAKAAVFELHEELLDRIAEINLNRIAEMNEAQNEN